MTSLSAAWKIGGGSGSKTEQEGVGIGVKMPEGEEICKTPTLAPTGI